MLWVKVCTFTKNSWDNYGLTNVLYSRPVRHAFSLSKLVSSLGVRRVEPPPLSSAKVGDALSSLRGVTRQEMEKNLSLFHYVIESRDRSWNKLSLSLPRGVTRQELKQTLSLFSLWLSGEAGSSSTDLLDVTDLSE